MCVREREGGEGGREGETERDSPLVISLVLCERQAHHLIITGYSLL